MGILFDAKCVENAKRIRAGKIAEFSVSSITAMAISLRDAKRNLTGSEFEKVLTLYKKMRKCTKRIRLDDQGFAEETERVIRRFDEIADYSKYSGDDGENWNELLPLLREKWKIDGELPPLDFPTRKRRLVFIFSQAVVLVAYCLTMLYVVRENRDLRESLESAEKEYYSLQSTVNSLESELYIYSLTAGVVLNSNQATFHTFGCKLVDSDNPEGFSVIPVNLCLDNGLSACPACHTALEVLAINSLG